MLTQSLEYFQNLYTSKAYALKKYNSQPGVKKVLTYVPVERNKDAYIPETNQHKSKPIDGQFLALGYDRFFKNEGLMKKIANKTGLLLVLLQNVVDWNKNVAARILPFPGLKDMGLLESNGHQNYVRWKQLVSYHPYPDGPWINSKDGIFHLDKEFYEKSGGILSHSEHYNELFRTVH